jgi:predicted CoA-binding protein
MGALPASVADFLSGRTFAVAGVSRTGGASAANPVFRKLRDAGYDVVPVNPAATEVEGVRCYPDLASIGRPLDGVVIATHPRVSLSVVEQCAAHGVTRVWMHRSVGQGSVSDEAVRCCAERGISCIAGGCPVMFCEPVDPVHRCMRWLFQRMGRVPR